MGRWGLNDERSKTATGEESPFPKPWYPNKPLTPNPKPSTLLCMFMCVYIYLYIYIYIYIMLYVHIYIYIYTHIYIYIHAHTRTYMYIHIVIMILLMIMITILMTTITTYGRMAGSQTSGRPNLLTKIIPAKIARLKLSGKFPIALGIPPLIIKIMHESNPLKSTMLVRRLAVIPLKLGVQRCGV